MADTLTPNVKLTNQTEGGNNNSWGVIADANFEQIDNKFGDKTAIVTTGGTSTLSDSQEIVAIVSVSGTLISNATIEFSGRGGIWVFRNATAGSFTVTAKVNGQTGVVVNQGDTRVIMCDGTDIEYGHEVAAAAEVVPVGGVMHYAGTTAPSGWVFCYGQAISRTTFSALYAALGTTYGAGDNVTTFNLPDLRGRVIAGKDDMGGSSANRLTNQSGGLNGDTLGATGGAETSTLAALNLPNITITLTDPGHTHDYNYSVPAFGNIFSGGAGGNYIGGVSVTPTTSSTTGISAAIDTTARGGAQTAVNNVQPTMILNTIMYTGVSS
jgi:microcystin-dependent protein